MTQTSNIKRQLAIILRYCYSARRAAQNMSANRMRLTDAVSQHCSMQICCFRKNLVWY